MRRETFRVSEAISIHLFILSKYNLPIFLAHNPLPKPAQEKRLNRFKCYAKLHPNAADQCFNAALSLSIIKAIIPPIHKPIQLGLMPQVLRHCSTPLAMLAGIALLNFATSFPSIACPKAAETTSSERAKSLMIGELAIA
jgi:hypothetical protein